MPATNKPTPYTVIDYSLPIQMANDSFFGQVTIDEDGCWIWNGLYFHTSHGQPYGRYKRIGAHRYSYMISRNETLTRRDDVCHHCDKTGCIKPCCLFKGSHLDNMLDASSKGRMARGEKQGQAKLKEVDVLEIRKLYAEGFTKKYIAAQYNVNPITIHKIICGLTWAWL